MSLAELVPGRRRIRLQRRRRFHVIRPGVDGGAQRQVRKTPQNGAPCWSADQLGFTLCPVEMLKLPESGKSSPTPRGAVQVTENKALEAVGFPRREVRLLRKEDEVWRVPTDGGEETRFLDGVADPITADGRRSRAGSIM